uniref:Uncharacterized protein n=1 Tax=Rhabditophanes sp. KR3021 TaxID=114890 RepID=A0AC35TG96_9BILA
MMNFCRCQSGSLSKFLRADDTDEILQREEDFDALEPRQQARQKNGQTLNISRFSKNLGRRILQTYFQ